LGPHQDGQPTERLDERFRRALDSILDLVVVERAIRDENRAIVDFEIVWMNNAPVDVAGRPRDELIGHRISELYPALAGGELIAGYREVVETGQPLIVDVMPYEDVIDGRPVSGYYTVQASKFEDGVLVASRDITPLETSRRDLEVALRELEGAHRLARLGTWRADFKRGSVVLSRALQRIYGLPEGNAEEFELGTLTPYIHLADRVGVEAAYERAAEARQPVVVEHRVVHADGSTRYIRSYAEPVVEAGEVVGMWGATQDVTDRVASRSAFEAEHSRRVAAEALAELASVLSGATAAQDIADAVFRTAETFGKVRVTVLGLKESEEPVLHEYFGGPGVPGEIEARYLRTPLTVDTPLTRAATRDAEVLLLDREVQDIEFPALFHDFRTIGFEALVVVPLRRASGEVAGALAVGWDDARLVDDDLLGTVREIAAISARTAERLEVLDLERSVAQTLQLGLLALDTHNTSAIVRARYQPADASLEIGGDWYDAVDLGDGRLAIAVGDVVGRGLPAATTMGQLRAALGITALQATDAADAVQMLDRYATHVPGAQCATVSFAIVDPARDTVSYASAGHVPPLLVTPDAATSYLEGGRSWPLGIETAARRPAAANAPLPPGSLLLLYTDGLIERRGEHLDIGLERLRDAVSRNWHLPLRRLKQAIFGALVDRRSNDDIALVALRTVGATDRVFADAFRAQPHELSRARQRFRAWLETHDAGHDHGEVLLAAGEAVANAIDHGSEDENQVVRVEATIDNGDLLLSVSDSGRWQPGIEGLFTGRGRGHLLMQAFATDVGIETDRNGTIATLRFARERQLT
jgi:serine phosphatase RsbU (regulator of sigma subunit)/PAS domain-containing protein/anti-sigma regulatory factor (Ser/Thr protein kinase)